MRILGCGTRLVDYDQRTALRAAAELIHPTCPSHPSPARPASSSRSSAVTGPCAGDEIVHGLLQGNRRCLQRFDLAIGRIAIFC